MVERAVSYSCELCSKPCQAPADSALGLLQLCSECQAKRFQAGLAAQRKADAEARKAG